MSSRPVESAGRRTPVKVILLGEPGVGKTSIFRRLKTGHFLERPSLTGVVEHLDWDYRDGDKGITLLITDTGGSDKQFTMTPAYYRNAMAVILVYGVDSEETFHRVKTEWLPIARDRVTDEALLFLVGNKTDLRNEVDGDEVADFCSSVEIAIERRFMMSCKTGEGVREAFKAIASTLIDEPPRRERSGTGVLNLQSVGEISDDHEPSSTPCSNC